MVMKYRSCFYRSIPMGPIDNGRMIVKFHLEKWNSLEKEKEKKFDPEEVYKGQDQILQKS